jgi:signal transduction histidine kinase
MFWHPVTGALLAWEPTAYSALALGAAAVSVLVAARIWEHRNERGSVLFIGLLLAAAGWAGSYGVQLGFSTRGSQLLWQQIGVAIGGSIPTLWVVFAFVYAGRDRWLTPAVRVALFLEPVVFAALVFVNPGGFVWESLTLADTTVGPALEPVFGVGMYAHFAYAYTAILTGLGALFYVFARNPTVYRTQAALLMTGAIVPMGVNVAYALGLSWGPFPGLDPTPFSFVLTGGLVGIAFFRFDLLVRAPVARRHVLEQTGDGLLVFDTDSRVVDANAVARQVVDTPAVVGRTPSVLFDTGDGDETGLADLDGRTVSATVGGREESYDLQHVTLRDSSDRQIGDVLSFRNVTGRDRYEQRLKVTQRVLRHNLRNDLSVIRARAEQLTRDGHDEAETIVETTERLVDLSNKTRLVTHLDGRRDGDCVPVDVSRQLDSLAERIRESYPEATVDCVTPAGLRASLPDPAVLSIPVENLVENAIVHSNETEPRVRVTAERVGPSVCLRIADDGPAIPEMELATLESGTEEPLCHGSSIGLWLAQWSVETAGGSLEFETGDNGNVVTVRLPAAD